ncbi:MAG: acyl-CoA thioesterase [Verrucomicrobiae bacterium]|nr:acyl-CoA thioesterase [Verrucomicrobiae bacterium]NNJ41749.1 acyl-CoA thioesterase [Akkermansiaceae bacterium]
MFFDTDCGGVVHNLAYLRMIETCRTHLAAKMGLNLQEMGNSKIFPVVLRTEIDYRFPAQLGNQLVIHGTLEKLERARFWCAFVMTRKEDQKRLVTCRQSLALVQMPQGKPKRLPDDWKTRWGDPAV